MSSVVIGLKYSRSMIGIRKGDNVNDKEQIIEGLVCVRDDIVNGIVRTGPETYEARFIENAIQYINDITKERDNLIIRLDTCTTMHNAYKTEYHKAIGYGDTKVIE